MDYLPSPLREKGIESIIYRETAPFPLILRGRAGVRV
jgi:hypothetical protein